MEIRVTNRDVADAIAEVERPVGYASVASPFGRALERMLVKALPDVEFAVIVATDEYNCLIGGDAIGVYSFDLGPEVTAYARAWSAYEGEGHLPDPPAVDADEILARVRRTVEED